MKLRADGTGYMWLVFVAGGLGGLLAARRGEAQSLLGYAIAIAVTMPIGLLVGWEFIRRRLEIDEQRVAENRTSIAWPDVAYYTWVPRPVEEGELPEGKLTIVDRRGRRVRLHTRRWRDAGKAIQLALAQLAARDSTDHAPFALDDTHLACGGRTVPLAEISTVVAARGKLTVERDGATWTSVRIGRVHDWPALLEALARRGVRVAGASQR